MAETGTALAPDAAADLTEGVLVETDLLARVAGIKLLRVDGIVALSPARLVASAGDPRAVPLTSSVVPGAGLEHAAQLLHECEQRSSDRRPLMPGPRDGARAR